MDVIQQTEIPRKKNYRYSVNTNRSWLITSVQLWQLDPFLHRIKSQSIKNWSESFSPRTATFLAKISHHLSASPDDNSPDLHEFAQSNFSTATHFTNNHSACLLAVRLRLQVTWRRVAKKEKRRTKGDTTHFQPDFRV